MPDEQNTTATATAAADNGKPKKPEQPNHAERFIERNGLKVKFTNFKVVRGENEGSKYLGLDPDQMDLATLVGWVGEKEVKNRLKSDLKQDFQRLFFKESLWETIEKDDKENVIRRDGFKWDVWEKEAADFTATGMPMKEIVAAIAELQVKQADLIANSDITNPDIAKVVKALNEELRKFLAMKEERSRSKSKETEPEPSVESPA